MCVFSPEKPLIGKIIGAHVQSVRVSQEMVFYTPIKICSLRDNQFRVGGDN